MRALKALSPPRVAAVFSFALLALGQPASAQQRDARMCATQDVNLASQRIDACSAILKSGRLHGEPAGVAYALRGLAFLDRGDTPHAIADLNQAIALAP